MRHLIDSLDLSVAETQEILDLADRIAADSAAYAHCADGKILATLFYGYAEHWRQNIGICRCGTVQCHER